MPITGKFEADFESFHREVVKADGELRRFQTNSGNVAQSFDRLSTTGGGAFKSFQQGLSQVDRTLAQVGVNLTPQVAVLGEIGAAAGKTATQFGLLGSAGLVLATAIESWRLGTWIGEVTGLHDVIATVTTDVMGWSTATETAAAKQDTLAKATQITGREITDYGEAIKITNEWAKKHTDTMDTSRERVSAWQREIAAVRKSGDLPALEKEMASGHSTLKQLAEEFGVKSVEALQYYQRELKKTTDAQKAQGEAQRAYAKLMSETHNEIGLAQMKAAEDAQKHAKASAEANAEGLRLMQLDLITFEEDTAAAAEAARQQEYDAWFKSVNEGVLIVGQAIGQVDAAVGASLQRTQAAVQQTVTSWQQAMQLVQSGQGTLGGTVQQGGAFKATREQIQRSFETGRYYGPVTDSGQVNWAKLGFGGTTVNVDARDSFYDSPDSVQKLANKVGNAVMTSMKNKGWNA